MIADPFRDGLHSVRLFPKQAGAAAYALTGIAARCDWALCSDRQPPQTYLHRTNPTDHPRHVFVSLRNPFAALLAFATKVLPILQSPFVLVTGSEDVTLPRQTDQRWRSFNDTEEEIIRAILDHPLLIRWFAENLEDDSDPRFAPLPTGMVYPSEVPSAPFPRPDAPPLRNRPLRILVGHRVRIGPQWDLRRKVNALADSAWATFCTVPDSEYAEPEFLRLMQVHAFVLCAEGGGLDPSPKAWQAILNGAIPIIRRTGTQKAYARLPVAFVDSWEPDSLTPARLVDWYQRLGPFYDTPALRTQTLSRLNLGYWWDQIAVEARPF